MRAVATGAGEIRAAATSVVDKGRTDGGADHLQLTVGKDQAASRSGIAPAAGDQATVATSAPVQSALPAGRASVALPKAAVPTQRTGAAAPGTTCATGSWVFVKPGGHHRRRLPDRRAGLAQRRHRGQRLRAGQRGLQPLLGERRHQQQRVTSASSRPTTRGRW